jgi:hypothetical protein
VRCALHEVHVYTACLVAAKSLLHMTAYRYHVRVLIPCYKESAKLVHATLVGALKATLPPGVQRSVYLCDDGAC